jgi:predicted metal-dependent phosphoesterase TrpH
MSVINLTPAQLRKAANLKEMIMKLQAQLAALTGAGQTAVPAKPARKKLSAAAIAKIRAGQKARWAKVKSAAQPVKKARRKMSAAARAKIAAAAKARWAKVRAAKAAK